MSHMPFRPFPSFWILNQLCSRVLFWVITRTAIDRFTVCNLPPFAINYTQYLLTQGNWGAQGGGLGTDTFPADPLTYFMRGSCPICVRFYTKYAVFNDFLLLKCWFCVNRSAILRCKCSIKCQVGDSWGKKVIQLWKFPLKCPAVRRSQRWLYRIENQGGMAPSRGSETVPSVTTVDVELFQGDKVRSVGMEVPRGVQGHTPCWRSAQTLAWPFGISNQIKLTIL